MPCPYYWWALVGRRHPINFGLYQKMIPCRVPTARNLLVGIGRDKAPNKFWFISEDDLMPCPYYWWTLVGTRRRINFALNQKMISCRVPTAFGTILMMVMVMVMHILRRIGISRQARGMESR
ncbi:hypothetical protein MiSe_85150 [Microseira wollei NIES-4236]|uniref:Uncharacterized protein n=1 Tax=Microseira wollei NIES-4236 TaxID=2530354 RepID=A0AAV3XT25_9CYAN|nr:hypothetical protein MiSe_85150 [Microseira wollei NIES-4236]